MIQYAVMTAVGPDKTGIVDEISGIIAEMNINIEDSRMAVLGGEFAVIMLLSADHLLIDNIHIKKDEIEKKTSLNILIKKTIAPGQRKIRPSIPHKLSAMSMDHPGIVHNITHILHDHDVNIESLETHVAKAPISGAPIFNMKCTIIIPVEEKISIVKNELEELGEEMNVDIHLEAMEAF